MQKDDEQRFVPMMKEAEIIEVHPDNVEQHKRLGWRLTPEVVARATAATAAVPDEKPKQAIKGKG